jgi:hypothetical protein
MTLIHALQVLGVSDAHFLPELLEVNAQFAIAQALQQALRQLILKGNIRISIRVP